MATTEKTDGVRTQTSSSRSIDALDRRILGVLAQDAGLSYADLGLRVGLSAPAVHDRVKKLRASGCVRQTVALLDGPAIGKPLLAFIHVDSAGWGATRAFTAIGELPEVEEIHSVAGDACMLLKVRCASGGALEALLERLYATPGVKSTRSYIVLSTYVERPPQADITIYAEQ